MIFSNSLLLFLNLSVLLFLLFMAGMIICRRIIRDKTQKLKREIDRHELTEKALRESELRYKELAEMLPQIIFEMDTRGRLTFVNNQAFRQFGYLPEDFNGELTAFQMLVEEDRERAQQQISNVLRGQTPASNEYTALRKDNSTFPIIIFSSPIIRAGEAVGLRGVIVNISEIKRSEAAVKESEARFRMVTDGSLAGVVIVQNRKFLYANPAFADIFGYDAEDILLNLKPSQLIHAEDRDAIIREIASMSRQGTDSLHYEFRGIHKSGKIIHCELLSRRVLYDGKPSIIGTILDITKRKRAEENLKESESKFRTIVEYSLGGFVIVDDNFKIQYANDELSGILQYSKEELVGNDFRNFFDAESLKIVTDYYIRRQKGEKVPVRYEIKIQRKDGSECHALLSVSVIKDSQGNARTLAHFLDMTERKQLEEQLRHAQKMEAIGRLAGGIAHDFNNLLTIIQGYSELLLMQLKENDKLHREVAQIDKASQRAANLVQQLLAFSRKQFLKPTVINLNHLIAEIEDMLRRLLLADIQFRAELDQEIGSIRADQTQIEQVILNLVVNARDAMPQGGKLTLRTRKMRIEKENTRIYSLLTPGNYVVLTISDTGTGMDEETQSHLFEPFFTTKGNGKGTGLGLSTAYGIIRQSGGNIFVESLPGKGTTFKLFFPEVDNQPETRHIPQPERESANGNETILVVEDEEQVRLLICDTLKSLGYHVLDAPDGQQALEICRNYIDDIHLLLTDVVMPGINGVQLAQNCKPLKPEMKVIYMSGYTDDNIVQPGNPEKSVRFIQKPFSPAALAEFVRAFLEN
ncbi:MAG: PAS domain S-box protein [Calditrichia bacterium]